MYDMGNGFYGLTNTDCVPTFGNWHKTKSHICQDLATSNGQREWK
jgi:hypothetical protein